MKILCCCEYGNNRAVTFAHLLKWIKGNEVLSCGLVNNTPTTLKMLFDWADKIVVVDEDLLGQIPNEYTHKVRLYDVGPDIYPRPFNPKLYKVAKDMLELDPIE